MNHDASRVQHLQVSRIGLVVARVCWVIYGSYSCMLLVVLPESTSVKRVASLEPWSVETYSVIHSGRHIVCDCNNNKTNVDRECDTYCHQQTVETPTPRLRFVLLCHSNYHSFNAGQALHQVSTFRGFPTLGTLVIELTDLASSLQLTRVAMFLYCAGIENCCFHGLIEAGRVCDIWVSD